MVTRRLVVRSVFTILLTLAVLGPAVAQQADRVYIFGHVKNPGVYTLKSEMTVGDAIDAAGGFTEEAASVAIVRIVDGKTQERSASLNDTLIANDSIIVKR